MATEAAAPLVTDSGVEIIPYGDEYDAAADEFDEIYDDPDFESMSGYDQWDQPVAYDADEISVDRILSTQDPEFHYSSDEEE